MATFHWSEEHVCEEISGAVGWAYYSWAIQNRAVMFGSSLEMSSTGYVGAEVKRLKALK